MPNVNARAVHNGVESMKRNEKKRIEKVSWSVALEMMKSTAMCESYQQHGLRVVFNVEFEKCDKTNSLR
jgi:hypothetical protein